MLTATRRLARFAANTRFDKLAPPVRHQSARLIYDALICTVAGEGTPAVRLLDRTFVALGGASQATVIPGSARTSVPQAAFLNAMGANARDLDDNLLYHSRMGNTIVSGAIAMGEFLNSSGRELVSAVAAGYEVASRVSLSMAGLLSLEGRNRRRIVSTNPYGFGYNCIGAAIAAGRLLRLDERRMAHALGLAACSAPVPSVAKAVSGERFALCKPGMIGWHAWSGCLAAMLAQKGVEADDNVLEGPAGYWRMNGSAWFDPQMLTERLGAKWWIMDVSFKLEAAGTWMRPAIRALRMIMQEQAMRAPEIEKIDVYLFRHPLSKKLFSQTKPKSYLDAQVSYHYLLAATALGIPIEHWQLPRVYRSPAMQDMISRVELHPDRAATEALHRELSVRPHRATGALTTIRVRARGKTYSAQTQYGAGDPFDPEARASDADLDLKFRRFAAPVLGRKAARAPAVLWNLERGTSTRQLVRAFCRAR